MLRWCFSRPTRFTASGSPQCPLPQPQPIFAIPLPPGGLEPGLLLHRLHHLLRHLAPQHSITMLMQRLSYCDLTPIPPVPWLNGPDACVQDVHAACGEERCGDCQTRTEEGQTGEAQSCACCVHFAASTLLARRAGLLPGRPLEWRSVAGTLL